MTTVPTILLQVTGLSVSPLNPVTAVALPVSVYLWEMHYGFDQVRYGQINYNFQDLWVRTNIPPPCLYAHISFPLFFLFQFFFFSLFFLGFSRWAFHCFNISRMPFLCYHPNVFHYFSTYWRGREPLPAAGGKQGGGGVQEYE